MTRELCLNIDRNRISPVVLTQFHPGEVAAELKSAGIPWHVRRKKTKIPFLYWDFLRRFILREKIDAVISMNQGPNLHNVIVTPTIPGVGCVMRVAGVNLPSRIYNTEGRQSRRANILIFPSEYSAESNGGKYSIPAERIRVIPNGCNTDRFKYVPYSERHAVRHKIGLPKDAFILYTPSRVHYKKGQDIMAEAMAKIPGALKDKNVIWINSGLVQDAEVANRAEVFASSIPDHIKMLPPVANSAEYIAASDAVAIPSRDESFSLVALESAACGRIFAGTECGAIPAVAEGTGSIVVRKNCAKSLAEGLLKLLSLPPDALKSAGHRAAKFIREKYSINACAAKYADAIEEAWRHRRKK